MMYDKVHSYVRNEVITWIGVVSAIRSQYFAVGKLNTEQNLLQMHLDA